MLDADICYSCCRYFDNKLIIIYISCSIEFESPGYFWDVLFGSNRNEQGIHIHVELLHFYTNFVFGKFFVVSTLRVCVI